MTQNEHDVAFSRMALDLAARGIGLASPNPLVGCVIVSAAGEIVGEGAYIYDDLIHAEVIALNEAGEQAAGGTAYVSLEPHDHFGKTPPCTDALINAGIARIVCPIEDPNPLVSGRGFEKLRSSGIDVVSGILADEATRLNERFICWHAKKRPFVHLKLAISLDGRISVNSGISTLITGEAGRRRIHDIRHEHDAILIGGNTAAVDDPRLTDRSGKLRRRPLVRVVLDNRLSISIDSGLVTTAHQTPTLVFTNSKDRVKIGRLQERAVEVIETQMGGRDLLGVLDELRKRELQSVLVEGGSEIAGSFCDARLVDKVTFFGAPIIIGGRTAPNAVGGAGADSVDDVLRIKDLTIAQHGDDIEITGYPAV